MPLLVETMEECLSKEVEPIPEVVAPVPLPPPPLLLSPLAAVPAKVDVVDEGLLLTVVAAIVEADGSESAPLELLLNDAKAVCCC